MTLLEKFESDDRTKFRYIYKHIKGFIVSSTPITKASDGELKLLSDGYSIGSLKVRARIEGMTVVPESN